MSANNPTSVSMSDTEFTMFRNLIYERLGINMTPEKRPLLMARLQSRITKGGYRSFREYFEQELARPSTETLNELVDRVTTNHTFFWREPAHFDFLTTKVLPELLPRCKTRNRELRVWCAAASSGQEPYLLAMLLLKFFDRDYTSWDTGVLATDISRDILYKAIDGIYPPEDVQGLPPDLRSRFMTKRPDGRFEVKANVKKEVLYRQLNLMSPKFPFKKPFDVVFCRNVMIYFDEPTKRSLLRRIADVTYPGGYLFVGNSESVTHLTTDFKYVMPGVYRRPG